MGRRARVLVVLEAPDELAATLRAALDGATVATAAGARPAVRRVEDDRVDCVVSEYRLPDGDGLSLLGAVRERDPSLPFVLYTEAGPDELGECAVTANPTAYVRRERDGPAALAGRVEAALAERDRGDPTAGDGVVPTAGDETHPTAEGETHPTAGDGPAPGDDGETERRRRETVERYETILDTVADPVYTLDAAGQVTYANEATIETFGYPPEEFVGAHVSIGMEPEDIRRAERVIQELLDDDDRESATVEYEVLARDGTRIPVENKIALLPFDDGEFRGTAGVLRDVSDRRRRERRLGVLNRFLRYNVRNEVALIETHAAQLETRARDEEARELARELRERALAIAKTSHDVRRLERAIDRDLDDVTPTDAVDLVERVVARYRERFSTAEIRTDLPARATVAADTPLQPAVDNVVENALVHHDRDRPRVWVSIDPDEKRPGERLAITVADDGPGIPGEVREAVLGEVTDVRLRSGGVGLWVATWIVESFGGEVTIEDRQPRGTVVRLHLRRAEE